MYRVLRDFFRRKWGNNTIRLPCRSSPSVCQKQRYFLSAATRRASRPLTSGKSG